MKQKLKKNYGQSGFTLVELLVVISIMVVISTVVVIDFNRQRAVRSIAITKNEMVTNLRKVQSYMLSSKNLPSGEAVKYYVVTFTTGATEYSVNAVDSQNNFHSTIETIKLPTGVSIASLTIAPIDESKPQSYKCLQIIFSAPYGKMYARGADSCSSKTTVNIINDPVQLAQLNEREATILLGNSGGTIQHSVVVTPVSGLITPQEYDPYSTK